MLASLRPASRSGLGRTRKILSMVRAQSWRMVCWAGPVTIFGWGLAQGLEDDMLGRARNIAGMLDTPRKEDGMLGRGR